jgi:hypothetical protein
MPENPFGTFLPTAVNAGAQKSGLSHVLNVVPFVPESRLEPLGPASLSSRVALGELRRGRVLDSKTLDATGVQPYRGERGLGCSTPAALGQGWTSALSGCSGDLCAQAGDDGGGGFAAIRDNLIRA